MADASPRTDISTDVEPDDKNQGVIAQLISLTESIHLFGGAFI